jgi:hypothetical protein
MEINKTNLTCLTSEQKELIRNLQNILSPPVNIDEYNSHLVSDEFLNSCAKAGRLFSNNGRRNNI